MKEINILYEDNHILVAEKPPNMLSQGDNTGDADILTLLKKNIKERYNKPGNVYLGLVHRLDRPVGGVMVFAKTSKGAARLSDQIRTGMFRKSYFAVIHGIPEKLSATLVNYLSKNEKTNTVAVVQKPEEGKEASLDYEVVDTKDGLSLIHINLHTGRPHQIRVQLAYAGHPLYGDQKYGASVNRHGMQLALWSAEIGFIHPTTKEPLIFRSMPPQVYPWNIFKCK